MYVKYKSQLTGTVQVRDVRHFVTRPLDCEEKDKSITHGAVICDGVVERAALFADTALKAIEGSRSDGEPNVLLSELYYQLLDGEELTWFNSWEAAEKVLSELCTALDAGKQFFDLTVYGEDGEEELL